MQLENLQAAIEQAESSRHIREFEVGGQLLTFPRLSIGHQGAFEAHVRTEETKRTGKPSTFSLAATRNKAAMAMSGVLRLSKQAMEKKRQEDGEPAAAITVEEAQQMAIELQDEVAEGFLPYADRIFGGFTRDDMLFAVARSMATEYGSVPISYVKTLDDGTKEAISAAIDSQFVDKLFSNEPGRILENVFLWVVGLSEQAKPGVEPALGPGMTVEDIAKETIGDEGNSEREPDSE